MRKSLPWGIAALAIVLLGAAEEPAFHTFKARDAAAAFEKDSRRAEDEYARRMTVARKNYRDGLTATKNIAMKNSDLDDANKMQAQIDQLAEDIKSTARPPRNEAPLVVRSARYGAGEKWADVTKVIRSHLSGAALTNVYEGLPDPAFGVQKVLIIEGTYGGKDFVLSSGEGHSNFRFGEPAREKKSTK